MWVLHKSSMCSQLLHHLSSHIAITVIINIIPFYLFLCSSFWLCFVKSTWGQGNFVLLSKNNLFSIFSVIPFMGDAVSNWGTRDWHVGGLGDEAVA